MFTQNTTVLMGKYAHKRWLKLNAFVTMDDSEVENLLVMRWIDSVKYFINLLMLKLMP